MRRQARLGVNVESIDHLLIVYLNGQAGRDWCTHISECVWIYIYGLPGDNGRLQYLMGGMEWSKSERERERE